MKTIESDNTCDNVPSIPAMDEVYEIIVSFKIGDCFCQMGIGNPMLNDHTVACKKAMDLLKKVEVWQGISK